MSGALTPKDMDQIERDHERDLARWFRKETDTLLEDARERMAVSSGRGTPMIATLHMYCDHGYCAVREVSIVVKEFDERIAGELPCPGCRHQLKPHHVAIRE